MRRLLPYVPLLALSVQLLAQAGFLLRRAALGEAPPEPYVGQLTAVFVETPSFMILCLGLRRVVRITRGRYSTFLPQATLGSLSLLGMMAVHRLIVTGFENTGRDEPAIQFIVVLSVLGLSWFVTSLMVGFVALYAWAFTSEGPTGVFGAAVCRAPPGARAEALPASAFGLRYERQFRPGAYCHSAMVARMLARCSRAWPMTIHSTT